MRVARTAHFSMCLPGYITGFWVPLFGMFEFFCICWCNMGFVLAREIFRRVQGWIPLHLDQVSSQTDHSGSVLGPFLIVDFLETHMEPK